MSDTYYSSLSINPYSVLSAITGSFLLAILAGIAPPIKVKVVLIIINITACNGSSIATLFKPVKSLRIIYNIRKKGYGK